MTARNQRLINIYGKNCWMGYVFCKENPYTFHHIKKKCHGGSVRHDNGALLTFHAHADLNRIEQFIPKYYIELNRLFAKLNKTLSPPTKEYYEEVNKILRRVSRIMELSEYYQPEEPKKIFIPEWIQALFITEQPKIKRKGSIDILRQ